LKQRNETKKIQGSQTDRDKTTDQDLHAT